MILRANPAATAVAPIRIALVNIMDNAEGTERHFVKTIRAAHPNADITLCRMSCAKIDPKYFREQSHLLSDRYTDWHDVIGQQDFDLVIVTGINRGTLSYQALHENYADFWNESKELFRTLRASIHAGHTGHASLVCWSAFAAMKELYGVEKGIHPQKFYGLFEHNIESQNHPLVAGFHEGHILIPQSRSSFMNENDLRIVIKDHDGDVVITGPDGPAIWTLENDRLSCFINHLEYGLGTLRNEYNRDSHNGTNGFPLPHNYDPSNIDTPENIAVFKQLSESCAHFYKNLISLAHAQKQGGNTPELAL
ncbi:MAG: homoserine O-succinyltransferase [Pseudomonadota bacterium]